MKLIVSLVLLSCRLFAGQNSLSGIIAGLDGLPVPGATVYLQACDGSAVTVTDLKGSYVFAGLADGDYHLRAWMAGKSSVDGCSHLENGKSVKLDAALILEENTVAVTLKISPLRSADAAGIIMRFELSAFAAASGALDDAKISGALKSLESGEYEIVLAKPGSAYVGTCLVLGSADKSVLHTSGMEIAGADFVQAISDQAAVSTADIKRL